jgi:phosphoglycerate dehydrogenase-like enzyme
MAENFNVISTFQFSSSELEILRAEAQTEVACITNTEEFLARLEKAEVLCSNEVPNDWRERAPRLRWLQAAGAGVDGLRSTGMLDPDSGVLVTTAVGMHAVPIGEYVFGSILMFNRSWPKMVHMQDQRVWPRSAQWYRLEGQELAGRTLGIVGLGSIGRRIARLGKAFEMRVLATKRSVREGLLEPDVDQIYPLARLHTMLSECDYIVLSVPLTAETERLIGEPELRAMRPDAYLVNIARGRVVDEKALLRALQERWIAGAGLDVVEEEPLAPGNPLFALSNVILTPHISGMSVNYGKRLAEVFAENLRRYRAGEPLSNVYDVARGY